MFRQDSFSRADHFMDEFLKAAIDEAEQGLEGVLLTPSVGVPVNP